jgi:hypothetical protein
LALPLDPKLDRLTAIHHYPEDLEGEALLHASSTDSMIILATIARAILATLFS